MRASTFTSSRTVWLSLLAAALALWGVTLFSNPELPSSHAQRAVPGMQMADGGGGRGNG